VNAINITFRKWRFLEMADCKKELDVINGMLGICNRIDGADMWPSGDIMVDTQIPAVAFHLSA
jgi:hypothetical protein